MPTTRLTLNLVVPNPALAVIPALLASRGELLRLLLLGLRQPGYVIWADARLPFLDVDLAGARLLVTRHHGMDPLGAFCRDELRGGAAVPVVGECLAHFWDILTLSVLRSA